MNYIHSAQQFQVRLPSDFTCNNCTLRLLRQADEWANGYRFWSCADIDVIPRNLIECMKINSSINRLILYRERIP